MKFVDVRQNGALKFTRYARAIELADDIFGRKEVFASGRDFFPSSFEMNIGTKAGVPKVRIRFDENAACAVEVYNNSFFDAAQEFGRKYEERFKEEVTLRHNF